MHFCRPTTLIIFTRLLFICLSVSLWNCKCDVEGRSVVIASLCKHGWTDGDAISRVHSTATFGCCSLLGLKCTRKTTLCTIMKQSLHQCYSTQVQYDIQILQLNKDRLLKQSNDALIKSLLVVAHIQRTVQGLDSRTSQRDVTIRHKNCSSSLRITQSTVSTLWQRRDYN